MRNFQTTIVDRATAGTFDPSLSTGESRAQTAGVTAQIVIPVLNSADRLRICLESIRRVSPGIGIIVVDNGSTDDSVRVAESYGAKVLVYPGLRVGALRNRGVEAAQGDVLVFVDSDHELTAGWLETGLEILQSDRQIVAAGAPCRAPDHGTWVQTTWAIHRLRGPERQTVDWLGSGNLFVRREDFQRVGGFREDLVAAEDVELCHRLRQLGRVIVCDKRIQNIHHGEPTTLLTFFRKECWRGSSGVRAWITEGFPLRDLASLLWPLWHGVGAVVLLGTVVAAVMLRSSLILTAAGIGVVIWILPALILAIRTCSAERTRSRIPALAVLYFVYGMARGRDLEMSHRSMPVNPSC